MCEAGMSRKFREWQPEASWLFPPSPRDWLPEDHLVYFLLDVTAQIDISAIVNDYGSGEDGGQPPYHPRMMTLCWPRLPEPMLTTTISSVTWRMTKFPKN
jgi:hypothetical protein